MVRRSNATQQQRIGSKQIAETETNVSNGQNNGARKRANTNANKTWLARKNEKAGVIHLARMRGPVSALDTSGV
jgi:hypothetical protein